jgi:hypothetical protein
MRVRSYSAEDLVALLRERKIAVMDEMKAALGTRGDATVFRLLADLAYRTSYSNRGRYYTLDEVADFDEDGLWSYESVWFSIYGTLLATAESIVEEGEFGHFVDELDNVLHVGTKDALRKLVRDGRLCREKVGGRYLYCSAESVVRRQQVLARRTYNERSLGGPLPEPDAMHDELKAAIILFFSLLNEKQRRLYAGLESLKLGHGGDRRMAKLLGMGVGAVARGRRALLERDVEVERVRRAGAGRKPVEKKRPR